MPNLESFVINKAMITDDNIRDLFISNKTKTLCNFAEKLSIFLIFFQFFFSAHLGLLNAP